MKAVALNCTLKSSPEISNTEALVTDVAPAFGERGASLEVIRVVDFDVKPGVSSDEGEGDAWPGLLGKIRDAEILLIATPTWLGQPSSVAKRVLERLDALISEKDEDGRPAAYGKVAGCFVTGNEDGAHHIVAEVCQALIDIGFTVPAQAWTYWHLGPGPGPSYLESQQGHDWAIKTGRTAVANLIRVAEALGDHPFDAL